MDITKLKPIPKYILEKIKKLDKKLYIFPERQLRFYSYLTTIQRELVKVTVAVMTIRDVFYNKQVAVHGIRSEECWVNDIEYNVMGAGYKVGWYDNFAYGRKKNFEDGKWYSAKRKYYKPYSTLVNANYLNRFPKYKYSAYALYEGKCILDYLRIYEKYPQTELLLKLGISSYLATRVSLLKKLQKDKNFRKWLTENKSQVEDSFYSVNAILSAYKNDISVHLAQTMEQQFKELKSSSKYERIAAVVKDDRIAFFTYLDKQNISVDLYADYLYACNYLNLDMSQAKNMYPKNFMQWHDIRIDEYRTAKALKDEEDHKKLIQDFIDVANKYLPLQRNKKEAFICIIAQTPNDLVTEGEELHHCVGRMNYDQRIAKEQSLIFFIRNADSPDKPFVTLEYSLKNRKVLQCYGHHDSRPDDEVLHYVNKVWLPYANRKLKNILAA